MKAKVTNSAYMKFNNRLLLLNIVKKNSVSRAELARITGLTRAAITLLVDELIDDGIIIEIGIAESEYGRKPILLDINPNCYYCIGVSVSRECCYVGIINMKGKLLVQRRLDINTNVNADKCMKQIIESINKVIKESGFPAEKFIGIGVSAPGPLDIRSGTILNPPNFNAWHNIKVVQLLKENFNMDVFLENNSNSYAIAEKNFGRGADFNNFMVMVVDTGIGAGIIINNNLYRGVDGFGSEVGHTSIEINGKNCTCGNRGCLEVYASIPSVLEYVNSYNYNLRSWNEIVDRAINGERFFMEVVEREADYLSIGIINSMNILELEAVILTGDINYKNNILINKIQKSVSKSAITRDIHKLHILSSAISNNSDIISAATIVIERYFKGEINI